MLDQLSTGGRPQGLTNKEKWRRKERENAAVTQLATRLNKLRQDITANHGPKARLSSKNWDDLCGDVANEFSIPKCYLLKKKKACYCRISRGNLAGTKTGSPVAAIEPIMVEILTVKSRMRQPLTARDAISFANSLLEGSLVHEDLKDYHVDCGRTPSEIGELGYPWWRNFLARHPGLHVSKPVPFPNRRVTWSTYENFKTLYEETYSIWERCGIAEHLDEPVVLDRDGMVVRGDETPEKQKKFPHLPCSYRLLHPYGALNADEIGHNTNTTKDKL